jgi:cysteine desulfurase
VPLDVQALPVDLVSLAPHRFYGPKGVGVLYRQRRTRLAPLVHGGVQEGGFRGGMEHVAGIVGAGVAAELAAHELGKRAAHTGAMQRLLWEELQRQVKCLRLNGPEPGPRRLPTNLNVSPEGVEGEGLALALDLQGVAIHSGAACVTKSLKIPPTLAAIGLSPALARASVTLSAGADTTESEVRRAAERFAAVVTRLRDVSPGGDRP